jgi:hypothetical protein
MKTFSTTHSTKTTTPTLMILLSLIALLITVIFVRFSSYGSVLAKEEKEIADDHRELVCSFYVFIHDCADVELLDNQ